MKNYIVRGTDSSRQFRFFGANTTELVNVATAHHGTSPVVSAALGRTMTGTLMMGAMFKNDSDRVCVMIKGDGPIQGITVEADAKGNVKGYPHQAIVDIPKKENGKLDVSGAIGNAVMTVIKDIGMREPYTGQVPMLSGEIAEDFSLYFADSEQTNTAVILGVLIDRDYSIKQAGGIIIQVLPDATDEAITQIEERLKTFTSLTSYMDEGKSIEDIIKMLLGDDIDIMDTMEARFKCDCSKEQMERALISLGKQELTDIVNDDQEDLELVCHFCSTKYEFDKKDLKEILDEL
ncbi:Hsp33 family molecular chaperone HslO [Niameybacter massiliensis]|uniref:33 kDa chaperonin n=1 Tax=Holtiella tumoricola TaxID=3018743 RepID=A0AA42DWV4_9FIRM|nr:MULTISPECIES: Hsp33 family molecular chaperone HslO [Lachnospirales]MDA3734157.1 Hsp33 family molecular chaperone HslO [Holtiella tumoricola]